MFKDNLGSKPIATMVDIDVGRIDVEILETLLSKAICGLHLLIYRIYDKSPFNQ